MATPFFSVKKKGPIRQKSAWNQTSQIWDVLGHHNPFKAKKFPSFFRNFIFER
jgi:hypothetical protein